MLNPSASTLAWWFRCWSVFLSRII
jgi:hypothetical protein